MTADGAMAVVLGSALPIPQHLPSRIDGQDRLFVSAGIGVMLFDQGAIGRLDLGATGCRRHTEHQIGIAGGLGHATQRGVAPSLNNKKPPAKGGGPGGALKNQKRKVVITRPPKTLSLAL